VLDVKNDLRIASAARSLLFDSFAAELRRWAAHEHRFESTVTSRSVLRRLALIPLLHALFGAWVITATASLRQYWSPVPGYLAGTSLVLVAMVTVRQLWLPKSRAALWVGISGGVTTVVLLLLGYVFPLVNATTEPPSLIWRAWYLIVFALAVVFTIIMPWIAHSALRRAA